MKIISNIILFPIMLVAYFLSSVFILFPNMTYDEIVDTIQYHNGSIWNKIKYEWKILTKND